MIKIKKLLFIPLITFSLLYGNNLVDEAAQDPTTTFVIQSSFAFFKLDKSLKKGELRLHNLEYTPYFFRGKKNLSFGYAGYADIVDLWNDKNGIFYGKRPEGILIFFESSVKEATVNNKYNEVKLRFHSPYYNGLIDSLIFKVEILENQTVPAHRGELIDVTLFIN